MNRESVQFKSASERQKEAKICQQYGKIAIPAVAAALVIETEKHIAEAAKKIAKSKKPPARSSPQR